ncbi:MAG: hypothetical protein MHPSP_000086 [Paramarteilia canceri]
MEVLSAALLLHKVAPTQKPDAARIKSILTAASCTKIDQDKIAILVKAIEESSEGIEGLIKQGKLLILTSSECIFDLVFYRPFKAHDKLAINLLFFIFKDIIILGNEKLGSMVSFAPAAPAISQASAPASEKKNADEEENQESEEDVSEMDMDF